MVPFLKQVAAYWFEKGEMASRCFIFPNRRSLVFFKKYLAEEVKAGKKPVISPSMYTMNDFFYKMYGAQVTDKVTLLLELYECYRELKVAANSEAEPLDDFIYWGDVLLGDFGDVDKYLVDAKRIFTNVNEYRSIQDDFSWATETQKEALSRFLTHFKGVGGDDEKNVKAKFLSIWNLLLPLYDNFRALLRSKGMTYEGMVYRDLAERMKETPAVDVLSEAGFVEGTSYVFVGLNALNECEKMVLGKMQDAGIAHFCWDWSSYMIRDGANKSSFFMKSNVERFPQEFKLDSDGLKVPEFNVVSVSSSVGQVKHIPEILKNETGAYDVDDCAIVLPDEDLLIPVLNTIPPEIKDINVTMGYPVTSSSFYSFMKIVLDIQLHIRQSNDKTYFYHKQVWELFSNSIFKKLLGGDSSKVDEIKKAVKYFIPVEDLQALPFGDVIFRPIVKDVSAVDEAQLKALAEYQKEVIVAVASNLSEDKDMAMELEFAKDWYNCVNKISRIAPSVLPLTYMRLIYSLMDGKAVPFNGEPLKGLQIMGPLEMRALDFNKLVILSCNEGVFPRRSVSSSFIPPELRKGFGLPTYEFQDAVWAYYFYRMIQRADKVWMLYDSRTEGVISGEESRYIKQLEYDFNIKINRFVSKPNADISSDLLNGKLEKTAEHAEKIKSMKLSASSLQKYLECQAEFYYSYVEGLKSTDEVSEDMDAGMIGDIFHNTMQYFYSQCGGVVTMDYVMSLIEDEPAIKAKVDELIMEKIKSFEVKGKDLVTAEILYNYVKQTMKSDVQLMESKGVDHFLVFGLEKDLKTNIGDFHIKGIADRIDSFEPGTIRIVDYKTGKVEKNDVDINDKNAEGIVEKLFGDNNDNRPKIALQIFLYDKMLMEDKDLYKDGSKIINSIYSTAKIFSEPIVEKDMCNTFFDLAGERLKLMLDEMVDTSKEFARAKVGSKCCENCDFKVICGR